MSVSPSIRQQAVGRSVSKEWGDLIVPEACQTASDAGHEEQQVWMVAGELDEAEDVPFDLVERKQAQRPGLFATLRGNSVGLPLQAFTLTLGCTVSQLGGERCTLAMASREVGSEHENGALRGLWVFYTFRQKPLSLNDLFYRFSEAKCLISFIG
jgi:hypothetical protein